METAAPIPAVDFNFDSTCSSPYITAPSSPQRFGNFIFSAPTSPSRVSSLYPDHDDDGFEEQDFEFNFSGQLQTTSLTADELFDGGKIRPLKLKPQQQQQFSTSAVSSQQHSQNDGRETKTTTSGYGYVVHKKRRSLSPLRVTDIMLEQQETTSSNSQKNNPKSSYVSSILSFSKEKWKFKDLLLFRSASEGRATTGKDPLRKYTLLSKKEDVRNASFRSTDSVGSSMRRGGRPVVVSAHELHYTANRAVSEEMKRKTFLPYKQGLLGCLGFDPGMHQVSKSIGSFTRRSL